MQRADVMLRETADFSPHSYFSDKDGLKHMGLMLLTLSLPAHNWCRFWTGTQVVMLSTHVVKVDSGTCCSLTNWKREAFPFELFPQNGHKLLSDFLFLLRRKTVTSDDLCIFYLWCAIMLWMSHQVTYFLMMLLHCLTDKCPSICKLCKLSFVLCYWPHGSVDSNSSQLYTRYRQCSPHSRDLRLEHVIVLVSDDDSRSDWVQLEMIHNPLTLLTPDKQHISICLLWESVFGFILIRKDSLLCSCHTVRLQDSQMFAPSSFLVWMWRDEPVRLPALQTYVWLMTVCFTWSSS